jgi:hypothetical protein
MANGPGTPAARARRRMRSPKGPIGPEKWNLMSPSQQERYRQSQTKRGGRSIKKMLGMTKRPTAAGQARFGGVDVTGAQATAREQARMNEGLGAAAGAGLRGLVGAQMTEAERRRLGGGR